MEHADIMYKLFQVSYGLQVRFLTIIHSDHFGVDGVPDKPSLKQDWHLFQKKHTHGSSINLNVKITRC